MAGTPAPQAAAHLNSGGGAIAVVDAAGPPVWSRRVGAVHLAPAALQDRVALQALLREVGCAFVDAGHEGAVAVARAVHAADPNVQVIFVVRPDRRAVLERAILFAPGIGEVWLRAPQELDASLVAHASQIAAQRRHFERTREHTAWDARQTSAQRAERALISDAYLANLLQVLPDVVLSVDDRGRVLSVNPAVATVIGMGEADLVGEPLTSVTEPESAQVLEELLARAGDGPMRADIRFRCRDGSTGVAECSVTAVPVGATHIWAVVLHDVTEQRLVQDQLEHQTVELEHQIVEAEVARRAAEQARAEAQAASQAKSEFLATMSHELRTPLNAIAGYVDLMEMGIPEPVPAVHHDYLRRIKAADRHLLALITSVLNFTRLDAGELRYTVVTVAVGDLLRSVAQLVEPQVRDKGLRYRCTPYDERIAVRADQDKVLQILLNLVSNAIKFTAGGGLVELGAAAVDDMVAIHVRDTGRGIPTAKLERIFEPFVQSDAGLTRVEEGIGLGLAISRDLAEAMGGGIVVESQVGVGSTFSLLLPMAAV